MKVCMDIQSAVAQRAGVGRYTMQLLHHLGPLASPDESLRLFYFDFLRRGLSFEPPGAVHRAVRWCPGRFVQQAWKRLSWPPFDWLAGEADVYHFPNFVLPPLTKGKAVVTIHDMSFLRHREFAEEKNLQYLDAKIRDTVARAGAVITDSQFSADEIHALLDVPRAKLFPIHLGIAPAFTRPCTTEIRLVLRELEVPMPYLLTVGTVEPRKNIPFMIKLFESMTDFPGALVIAGMRGWKVEGILQAMQNSSHADRIVYLDYVPDTRLPALYAGAALFLVTSHYEGFGFPPLEAMACGTPVLSSAGGSLPEVLGEGAKVMEGFEVEAWRREAMRLLDDEAVRNGRINAGRRRAAQYTWARTARQTWDVYRSL
jgi:glycosyltransferase involved in cell wall biosynthesis